jgi:hypothetical protein
MNTVRPSIAVLALGTLIISTLLLSGCAKKLEGDAYANQKPIVWFVNVPPESARSSVNPIVNWYGQDQDGQIDFYRYMVIREDIIGDSLGKPVDWNPSQVPLTETEVNTFVQQHLVNISDTLWTNLVVRADSTDPHTSNIIPMSAQIDSPVLTYVAQFVFLQAFDEEGLGSDVVYRRFLRNDNPPATRIVGFIDGVPFINSTFPSGSSTGIRIRWSGSDVIDYPSDPPPFEFEWKLFGPYSQEDYDYILEHFQQDVFVTNDARVLWRGQPPQIIVDTFWNDGHTAIDSIRSWPFFTSLIICDTTYEGGSEVVTCDTMPVDDFETGNVYGVLDTLLRVYDEEFINSEYYIVADSSHDDYGNVWTTELRDSIYNVYKDHPADTTQAGKFIFVVRSRDDAKVPDLTPAYRGFTVINPQHERDILFINWGSTTENRARENASIHRNFWNSMVQNWILNSENHSGVVFVPTRDWRHESQFLETASVRKPELILREVLKYKVAVMVQDIPQNALWSSQGAETQSIYTALQTGVNVWVVSRVPFGQPGFQSPLSEYSSSPNYPNYQYFFGVQRWTFPGWGSHLYSDASHYGLPRVEDFVGALSLDKDQWPDLEIDTSLLRRWYLWEGQVGYWKDTCGKASDGITDSCWRVNVTGFPNYPYKDTLMPMFLGALPQVGWCERTYETECMYLFKSLYGNEHQLFRNLSFHGRPVAIRLNRGLFRTVHFMFSPLAMKNEQAKELTIEVLNWLYDGRSTLFNTAKRSGEEAALADDLGSRYWDAYWQADGDREKFYELLKNAY